MANSKRICSVDECGKITGVPGAPMGFCSAHYNRLRRHGSPFGGRTPVGEPMAWLRAHVDYQSDECLIWPFAVSAGDGYGRVQFQGKIWVASRAMCQMANGASPLANMDAAHSCGKGHEACVNPKHLSWKTRSDNHADKIGHGTATRGMQAPWSKLTEDEVKAIREMRGRYSQSEIAKTFNVSNGTIQDILQGRNWGWLT